MIMHFRGKQEKSGIHMTEKMEQVEEEACTKEDMEKEIETNPNLAEHDLGGTLRRRDGDVLTDDEVLGQ